MTEKPTADMPNPQWSVESMPVFGDEPRDKRRLRSMAKDARTLIAQDGTHVWRLFDLNQFQVPPRRVHRNPLNYFVVMDPRRSVADALFPRGRQILLLVFFQEPDSWYRQTDLHKLSGAGLGMLQREVYNLLGAKLIEAEPVENQRYSVFMSMKYRANRQSPLFQTLCLLAQQFQYTAYKRPLDLPPDTYYQARGYVDLSAVSRSGTRDTTSGAIWQGSGGRGHVGPDE